MRGCNSPLFILMIRCLSNLIDLQLSCAASTNTCYVYKLNDISWLNESVFSRIADNRFKSIDELKQSLMRNALNELTNEITSFMSRKIQLKDFVGYYNDYGKTKIGVVKDSVVKGILVEKNYRCSGVKLVLNEVCFHYNPTNTTASQFTFNVITDDGAPVPYTVNVSSAGRTCHKICDSNGDPIKADYSIYIYTNEANVEFCSVAIPCQTGCNGRIVNECATVKGAHGTISDLKSTFGITASVSCVCDFGDVFCNAATQSRIAELLLIRLEHHIAKYAFDNSRMDVFKLKADQIVERLKSNNEMYSNKFTNYIEPIAFEISKNRNYKPCYECTGIVYGVN